MTPFWRENQLVMTYETKEKKKKAERISHDLENQGAS
jgi:hypothetical protein